MLLPVWDDFTVKMEGDCQHGMPYYVTADDESQFRYIYSRIMAHSVTKNKIETTLKKMLVYYFSVTEQARILSYTHHAQIFNPQTDIEIEISLI